MITVEHAPVRVAPVWTRLGQSSVRVQRLGHGLAPIARGEGPEAEVRGVAAVEEAWRLGIRTFDVAPFYGQGRAERRAGAVLATHPREEYVLSTKVGRLPDGSFDYSETGIRRRLAESLERLGLDRVDYIHVHDPDLHEEWALEEGIPAALALRDEGIVGAVGVGMNQSPMLARFVERTDIDCVLLANRYTLLEQTAQRDLLPLCVQRGVSVVVGGVFNSGVLADPRPGATYEYHPAGADVLARAQRLRSITDEYGIPLAAAALQFPLAHPAVACELLGAGSAKTIGEDVRLAAVRIPTECWEKLRDAADDGSGSPWPTDRVENAPVTVTTEQNRHEEAES